jgi:Polyketide cyclase / dehydrase and lipid transport
MLTIEKSMEVNVPVGTAYHQWTQFEEFPRFTDWVKEVHQLDERHLHLKAPSDHEVGNILVLCAKERKTHPFHPSNNKRSHDRHDVSYRESVCKSPP